MRHLPGSQRVLAVRGGRQRIVVVGRPLLTVVCDCGNNIRGAAELWNVFLVCSENRRRDTYSFLGTVGSDLRPCGGDKKVKKSLKFEE